MLIIYSVTVFFAFLSGFLIGRGGHKAEAEPNAVPTAETDLQEDAFEGLLGYSAETAYKQK